MADNIKLEDFSIGNDQTKTDDMLSTIGIVGSGRMGKELISYFSQKGFEVRFLDLTDETIEDTYNKITATLDAKIAHWGLTESEKRGIMSRIKGSSDYKIFSKCDIVIEAINTNTKTTSINIRQDVFKKIEEH
ncbi:MAG: 3-hydroxyacyl-CoA dehydrogenase NAD-binding domain-containing protein, partial [Bacteroidota bacterium]|nr:3-hydroxyacyl-CoA dehydrogenase NAD-binding domain-containing protein [Bacteroidota bacterium]